MSDKMKKARSCAEKLPILGEWLAPCAKAVTIRFSGVIADKTSPQGGISYERFRKAIDKAFDKRGAKVIVMVINSPGGAPAQCSLITSHIRRLADEKELPVYAFVEDVAASGGYWLACAGDEIYAQETSIVGSIGVIFSGFGFEDFIEKHQIHRRLYTAGNEKSFMDPFVAPKAADEKRIKTLQSDIHEAFTDWVKERRGMLLQGTDKTLFEGQIWGGNKAKDAGLIDGIGERFAVIKEKFGEDIRFVDVTPEKKTFFPLSLLTKTHHKDIASEIIDAIETRTLWQRFGL
jgi:signal peptide peptidase SppA